MGRSFISTRIYLEYLGGSWVVRNLENGLRGRLFIGIYWKMNYSGCCGRKNLWIKDIDKVLDVIEMSSSRKTWIEWGI